MESQVGVGSRDKAHKWVFIYLFIMVHLVALTLVLAIQRGMIGWCVNNVLERM
jgi:hypothetical protein